MFLKSTWISAAHKVFPLAGAETLALASRPLEDALPDSDKLMACYRPLFHTCPFSVLRPAVAIVGKVLMFVLNSHPPESLLTYTVLLSQCIVIIVGMWLIL
jgi:hypothetical protein